MHITIIGITTDPDEIYSLTESDLDEDNHARYYYDYWRTIDVEPADLVMDIGTMLMSIPEHPVETGKDDNGWYFSLDQETIDAYFHGMWTTFKKYLADLNNVTEADMKRYYLSGLAGMKSTFSDEYDSVFYSADEGWQTIQDFMRAAEPGKKYYVCGALDAHY